MCWFSFCLFGFDHIRWSLAAVCAVPVQLCTEYGTQCTVVLFGVWSARRAHYTIHCTCTIVLRWLSRTVEQNCWIPVNFCSENNDTGRSCHSAPHFERERIGCDPLLQLQYLGDCSSVEPLTHCLRWWTVSFFLCPVSWYPEFRQMILVTVQST